MDNESVSDIHRSQAAFLNKRTSNHLETMSCQLLLHKPLLHLMLKLGSQTSFPESDRIWLWMSNSLKEKRNREKYEKDVDKPVTPKRRVNLLTSSQTWRVHFHGTVHAALEQSVKLLRGISHAVQSCSLLHSVLEDKNDFLTFRTAAIFCLAICVGRKHQTLYAGNVVFLLPPYFPVVGGWEIWY